jgi:hypothetical protein
MVIVKLTQSSVSALRVFLNQHNIAHFIHGNFRERNYVFQTMENTLKGYVIFTTLSESNTFEIPYNTHYIY